MEKFFVREREGRRRIDFLRLWRVSESSIRANGGETYSAADAGRWMSSPGRPDGDSMSSSLLGITSGDGDGSVM